MKKTKLLSMLLAIAMVVSIIPANVFAAADKDTITIELSDYLDDGWTDNTISTYLWDGENKTFLTDDITIESGSSATFTLDVDVNASVLFYWREGDYANECSFTITRGDEVYKATGKMCESFENGNAFYMSTPDGAGDISQFYDIWSVIGTFNSNENPIGKGCRMTRTSLGKYTFSEELEAGDYEFKLAKNNNLEEKYGTNSGGALSNGVKREAVTDSAYNFKFTLTSKANVIFIFNPEDATIIVSWADGLTPYQMSVGIGEHSIGDYPFDTLYYYTASQHVIPSDMLNALDGKTITDLTYYYTVSEEEMYSQNITVYLQEVKDKTVHTFADISDGIKVFEDTINLESGEGIHELILDFNKPYVYSGGNLLVTVVKSADDWFSGTEFVGSDGIGSAVYVRRDDEEYILDDLVGKAYDLETIDFMPKTTFGYKDTVYEITNFENGEATAYIPKPGQYSVVFAAYDGERLDSVDVVPVTVTNETVGIISGIETDIFLGRGDKIMLLSDTESITPLCEEYLTNLIIL